MTFLERAELLEELANLAVEIGDHELEEKCLIEMAAMQSYLQKQLST